MLDIAHRHEGVQIRFLRHKLKVVTPAYSTALTKLIGSRESMPDNIRKNIKNYLIQDNLWPFIEDEELLFGSIAQFFNAERETFEDELSSLEGSYKCYQISSRVPERIGVVISLVNIEDRDWNKCLKVTEIQKGGKGEGIREIFHEVDDNEENVEVFSGTCFFSNAKLYFVSREERRKRPKLVRIVEHHKDMNTMSGVFLKGSMHLRDPHRSNIYYRKLAEGEEFEPETVLVSDIDEKVKYELFERKFFDD